MENDVRTETEFRGAVISHYIPSLLKLVAHKGDQYSGGDKPALINFYEGAKLAKDTPQHYLMTQATKQWYVLCDWSKHGNHGEVSKREIVQRLFDIITYMFLLLFMIEENGEQRLPGEE